MKKNQILYLKVLLSSALTLHLLSCGANKGGSSTLSRRNTSAAVNSSSQSANQAAMPSVLKPEEVLVETKLNEYNNNSPAPILLNAYALKQVFLPVFGTSPRKNSKITEFNSNVQMQNTEFFNTTEKNSLGSELITFGMQTAGTVVRPSNMDTITSLTSDYIYSLRAFAGDACRNLIETEFTNGSTEANASNTLVAEPAKLETKINSFLTSLIGYKSESSAMHAGVKKYREVFLSALNSQPTPANAAEILARRKISYQHLCIALTTDVRVFTR
jgi:hypothetical protein